MKNVEFASLKTSQATFCDNAGPNSVACSKSVVSAQAALKFPSLQKEKHHRLQHLAKLVEFSFSSCEVVTPQTLAIFVFFSDSVMQKKRKKISGQGSPYLLIKPANFFGKRNGEAGRDNLFLESLKH